LFRCTEKSDRPGLQRLTEKDAAREHYKCLSPFFPNNKCIRIAVWGEFLDSLTERAE
jgi:hypothetical protein